MKLFTNANPADAVYLRDYEWENGRFPKPET